MVISIGHIEEAKTAEDVVRGDLTYIVENLREELNVIAGKNLLLTGGAGSLGYYLIQAVLHWNKLAGKEKAINITVYDNFIRGFPRWLKNLEGYANLKLVKHDISKSLPRDIGDFQFIMHAASVASPTFYRKYPIETMDANTKGLRHLLEYCVKQKKQNKPIEGFLFFSSSEIYGDPTNGNIPTPESYRGNVSCTGPRACYDESKRYGETLCVNFARIYDLPVKIARPFNNYGPGMRISDRRAIPDFVQDILNGRDIVMLSDGSSSRTFCYVADAIVGYYKVLVKGCKGEAYNIGAEAPECSIADLVAHIVDLAREYFGYKGKVVRKLSDDKYYLADNPYRRCPAIEKARSGLGYSPTIGLDEGLRRSLVWYDNNRDD